MVLNAMIENAKYKNMLALGLMSGTSLDGIDAALLETDGDRYVRAGMSICLPYDLNFRKNLRSILWEKGSIEPVENKLTLLHAKAVRILLKKADLKSDDIDVIGFHGHTILHEPDKGRTYQIGDGALLADETNIDVVSDLRTNDIENGGQGAPLVPLYHLALTSEMEMPIVVLNIGGVSNITYIDGHETSMVSFDIGPGNALIDDWVNSKLGQSFDYNGEIAASGRICKKLLNEFLSSEYLKKVPPKSIDRNEFEIHIPNEMSVEDGAATLTALTSETIKGSIKFFPKKPKRWLVTGGGRHNHYLMKKLTSSLGEKVEPIECIGLQGDALEAQAFSYLAVRSIRGLHLTLPNTTGVRMPVSGGKFYSKPQL